MKYFTWINFAVAFFFIWKFFSQGGSFIFKSIGTVFYVFLPSTAVVSLFSIKTCTGDFICSPTFPVVILTFVFLLLFVYILTTLSKKQPLGLAMKWLIALALIFNIGNIIEVVGSSIQDFKYRPATFEQKLDTPHDFPKLGFSIKTPNDWVDGKYRSDSFVTLIPQRLKDKPQRFSELVIGPSFSLVDSYYIPMNIYSVIDASLHGSKFCKLGGLQPSKFAGHQSLVCIIDNPYEYTKIIRITDLSNLNPNWKPDNLIWFTLPTEHKNLAPIYESVLSTFSF